MRKTIKATTIAICALVITLFAASCSKDNNTPDAEKTAEQALNNMVGTYNGTLRTDNNTPNSVLTIITWTANKNSTIIVNDFPYNLLANGVSKEYGISIVHNPAECEGSTPKILYYNTPTTRGLRAFQLIT